MNRLSSWSPVVRERAAIAIAGRKEFSVSALVKLLDSPSLETRLGACQALEQLKAKAASAVPALRKTLRADDLWLRVKAADALAAIGKPAVVAVPELLEMITRAPAKNDPRAMEQRFLCFAMFQNRGGLLSKSLEGVDRGQLRKAVVAGLRNEDGRARSAIGNIYENLSFEEIKPLLPPIYEAIVTPAPSGEMFADGVRIGGLKVLAKHHVEEGMKACVDYIRNQSLHASQVRTPQLLAILETYGAHAQAFIPELEKIAATFDAGEGDFPKQMSRQKAQAVRDSIETIRKSGDRSPLKRIH